MLRGYYRCTIERQPWELLTSTTPRYYQVRRVYANPELPALTISALATRTAEWLRSAAPAGELKTRPGEGS